IEGAEDGADQLADVLAVRPLPQPPLQRQHQRDQLPLGDRTPADVAGRRGGSVLAAQASNHDRLPSATSPPPTRSMNVWTRLPPRTTSSSVPSASSPPLAMIATWLHSPSTSSITWLDSTTVPPPPTYAVRIFRITCAETGPAGSSGSSITRIRGAWIKALASRIFLVMPAESSTTSLPSSSARSRAASSESVRSSTVRASIPRISPT